MAAAPSTVPAAQPPSGAAAPPLRYSEQKRKLAALAGTKAEKQFSDIYEQGFNKLPETQWESVGEMCAQDVSTLKSSHKLALPA